MKKPNIYVRLVGKPDHISAEAERVIRKLHVQTFGPETKFYIEGSYWWIAYCDGLPIGFTGLKPFTAVGRAFLYRSGVLTAFQGNGLQKRFIRIRERLAKKIGLMRMVTYTSEDNLPSANSLISCGYKLYKPKTPWGIAHALYFAKDFD